MKHTFVVATLGDVARVVAALPLIEFSRRLFGPARCVPVLRRIAMHNSARDDAERQRLRRVIAFADARFFPRANCYRRVLLETLLDRDAAREPLHLGLRSTGGPGSGHAWLADRGRGPDHYDMEIVL